MNPRIIKIQRNRITWIDSFGDMKATPAEYMPQAEIEKLSDKDQTRISAYHKTRNTIARNWDVRHPRPAK